MNFIRRMLDKESNRVSTEVSENTRRAHEHMERQREIFKEGDFVQHLAGGPVMRVTVLHNPAYHGLSERVVDVKARHVSAGGIHEAWFSNDELVKVDPPKL